MNKNLKTIEYFISQTDNLSDEKKAEILKALKDANKEIEITAFKLERTEKVKRTTAILLEETIEELEQKRKAVEEQNRELEIEAALEKVRSSALSLKQPEDMLDVCRIISDQLDFLGVNEIRNVQTAIIKEQKGTYLNYQYFTAYNKSIVEETEYNKHPKVFEMVQEMKRSENSTFSGSFKGKELDRFREYRKQDYQFLDPILDEATSIHYYFYSIGSGGLGLSTYKPLNDDELKIFKRFHKVFTLAYRRFIDIEKAIAQAREAQIETALERVRSKTMAMHNSQDVGATVVTLFDEVLKLGLDKSIRVGIGILEGNEGMETWSATSTPDGKVDLKMGMLDMTIHPMLIGLKKAWERGETGYSYDYTCDDVFRYYEALNNEPDYPFQADLDSLPENEYHKSFFYTEGILFSFAPNPISDEAAKVLDRFAGVFGQTYRRYLDLQKAEEQNKIIQAENERKTKELEEARQLQLSMLPRKLPNIPNLDIAVYMKTATEVGGDYYDFHIQPDGALNVLVGDATGHGMMSGMMVSIMKSFFIASRNSIELKEFFENSNESIKDMQLGRLMMACTGVQINSKKVIATNAGMPPLIYFRNKSQKAGEFVINHMPLGAMKGSKYSLKKINYEKNDTLLLMSDGFAELKNQNNEQYGYPTIIKEFKSVVQKNSNEIVEHLKNSASQWAKGTELDDDITFVVIKFK